MAEAKTTLGDSDKMPEVKQDVLENLDVLMAVPWTALHVLQVTAIRNGDNAYWRSDGGFETTKALRAALDPATPHLT